MAKMEWGKRNDYDNVDHYEWTKRRNKVEDAKWRHHSLKKPKKTSGKITINLKEHEKHDWQPLKGPFGPHEGKIICNTCGGKWVAWLPKGSI